MDNHGFRFRGGHDGNDASWRCMAYSVVEQVPQHLLEATGIYQRWRQFARYAGDHLDPTCSPGQWGPGFDNALDELTYVDGFAAQGELTNLCPRQREEVLDKPLQADHFVLHYLQIMLKGRRWVLVPMGKGCFKIAAQRSHRCTQFVRYIGDQFTPLLQQPRNGIALAAQFMHRPLKVDSHGIEIGLQLRNFILAHYGNAYSVVALA